MSFFNLKIVEKPKKQHRCEICMQKITGRHVYFAGKNIDGDFITMRMHEKCQKEQFTACAECPERGCNTSFYECYLDRIREKEQSK